MKLGSDLAISGYADRAQATKTLASWYAPGLSDELGDRLLMFDNSSAPSLELLRFRSTLTASPGFEVALRRRVERLRHFRHPSFARVRTVEYLGHGEGLTLLSNHAPGKRLSEVLQDARGPGFATQLIQQLTPALASLQQSGDGDGTGHGALAPSRVVVTPEGRLMIVEYVLGPALERLQFSASRMRAELGIALPPVTSSYHRLDSRTDYFQLGVIALSLLLGRPVRPDESQENIARLLEQAARLSDRQSALIFGRLRVWLERALQLNNQVFESAGDAQDALYDLSSAGVIQLALPAQPYPQPAVPVAPATAVPASEAPAVSVNALFAEAREGVRERDRLPDIPTSIPQPPPTKPIDVLFVSEPAPAPAAAALTASASRPVAPVPEPARTAMPSISSPPPDRILSTPKRAGSERQLQAVSSFFVEVDPHELRMSAGFPIPVPLNSEARPLMTPLRNTLSTPPKNARLSPMQAVVSVLALAVIGEGIVIGMLMQRRNAAAAPVSIVVETLTPGADVLVDGRSAGVTPLQVSVGAEMRSIRVVEPRSERPTSGGREETFPEASIVRPASTRTEPRTPDTVVPASRQSAGIRLISPIEVEVFEGDRRLGSSATGIVSASAGRHEFELVNSVLGFRTRQTVDLKSGQVTPVQVSPPNGRLSINAVPWAEVWIGGKPVGETPLGNLSVPLGEHEIIFRHPQLGEQRRTAIVRVDAVTRVSVNLQQ